MPIYIISAKNVYKKDILWEIIVVNKYIVKYKKLSSLRCYVQVTITNKPIVTFTEKYACRRIITKKYYYRRNKCVPFNTFKIIQNINKLNNETEVIIISQSVNASATLNLKVFFYFVLNIDWNYRRSLFKMKYVILLNIFMISAIDCF